MLNNCAKFHSNFSTKYRDIASCEIDVNGRTDGRSDGRPENTLPLLWILRWRTQNNSETVPMP